MAKMIGHITWSCLLRRPAMSLPEAGGYGPRSPRNSALLPLFTCNLASPWLPWVHATDASGGARGGYEVTRRWCDPVVAAAAGSCAERWRFLRKSLPALDVRLWAGMSGKCRRPAGFEPKRHTKSVVLTCILLWLEIRKKIFTQCLMIALSPKICRHPNYSPSLLGASCLEV